MGTVVGAEVPRCRLAEARQYHVADSSYYIEARYTGEGALHVQPRTSKAVSLLANRPSGIGERQVTTAVAARPILNLADDIYPIWTGLPSIESLPGLVLQGTPLDVVPAAESYGCDFVLRLSLRVTQDKRESLEVDDFLLLGRLVPNTADKT